MIQSTTSCLVLERTFGGVWPITFINVCATMAFSDSEIYSVKTYRLMDVWKGNKNLGLLAERLRLSIWFGWLCVRGSWQSDPPPNGGHNRTHALTHTKMRPSDSVWSLEYLLLLVSFQPQNHWEWNSDKIPLLKFNKQIELWLRLCMKLERMVRNGQAWENPEKAPGQDMNWCSSVSAYEKMWNLLRFWSDKRVNFITRVRLLLWLKTPYY